MSDDLPPRQYGLELPRRKCAECGYKFVAFEDWENVCEYCMDFPEGEVPSS
jgi:hypothetical protein